jgi:hypothetical protein
VNFLLKFIRLLKEKNQTKRELALNIPNKPNEPIYGNNSSNIYQRVIFKITNLAEDNPYLLRVLLLVLYFYWKVIILI